MHIKLSDTGKRYNREWIFRHFDYTFLPEHTYAITGPNGSGKSTLLQIISGSVMHSEGTLSYLNAVSNGFNEIKEPYKQIAFAAPYLELIEEMTATELLDFHSKFKPLTASVPEILADVSLQKSAHKQIRYFSSGMKQRLKLAQAFYSKSDLLLLDEPITNLDQEGIELYRNLLENQAKGKTIIVSSNDKQEYDFCNENISILSYK